MIPLNRRRVIHDYFIAADFWRINVARIQFSDIKRERDIYILLIHL